MQSETHGDFNGDVNGRSGRRRKRPDSGLTRWSGGGLCLRVWVFVQIGVILLAVVADDLLSAGDLASGLAAGEIGANVVAVVELWQG